ncbi:MULTISPECIES: MOSC domain-containing protein [Rhodomicrobium]|uniref:MOSC domain-containing protein n=1 Tax=Rhodomicrobium TaxID=1068 RepID=UPI000B4B4C4A|nr:MULTISPECIES: MOSC domain-containing protein [Rhodomicrobium]
MTLSGNLEIVSIYRYPIKGLSPEKLDLAALVPGETIRSDRAFAIENGPGRFDPENPKYLPKVNFLMLMRNERLAALQTAFDDETQVLTVSRDGKQVARGALNTKLGRQLVEQFFAGYMQGELKGAPRIVSAPGHSFSDVAAKCLHLVNMASVRDLEGVTGMALDPLRFRANLYFEGADAWEEKKWIGRKIRTGSARLKIYAETARCEATNVNPQTAERDAAIPPTLLRTYGDTALGIYATVIGPGEIRPGDRMELED